MVYLQYAVWAVASFFILSWTFAFVFWPNRVSPQNLCTLISWWASATGAALGFYSVLHLLWLMPLALILGSLGIIGVGVIGIAIAVLVYFSRHASY